MDGGDDVARGDEKHPEGTFVLRTVCVRVRALCEDEGALRNKNITWLMMTVVPMMFALHSSG